jgi:hypothetical protein
VCSQTQLLEIIPACRAGGGFADLLHRRQKQSNQDGNDCNHHEQLNEREPSEQ